MKIEFTSPALQDLEELREYLADRSPSGLVNMIADIEGTVRSIRGSIAKGRKTPHDEVWEKITPKYKFLIPYYIRRDTLYILRVYRSNRDNLDYGALILPK